MRGIAMHALGTKRQIIANEKAYLANRPDAQRRRAAVTLQLTRPVIDTIAWRCAGLIGSCV